MPENTYYLIKVLIDIAQLKELKGQVCTRVVGIFKD